MAKKKAKKKVRVTATATGNETSVAKKTVKVAKRGHPRIEKKVPGAVVSPLSPELVARAKKVGLSDEQIATYTDDVALKMICDQIKPQATAHPPIAKKKFVYRRPVGVPAQAEIQTEITQARATHISRASYDEDQLGDACLRLNIDPASITKLTFERNCVLNGKGYFETQIKIDYVKTE